MDYWYSGQEITSLNPDDATAIGGWDAMKRNWACCPGGKGVILSAGRLCISVSSYTVCVGG